MQLQRRAPRAENIHSVDARANNAATLGTGIQEHLKLGISLQRRMTAKASFEVF
jgi:hypothetical protein